MNRNAVTRTNQPHDYLLNRETAVHEASHAVAIYLGNKQKQLPAIFFQIIINRQALPHNILSSNDDGIQHEWIAKIEGGRLIHSLPTSIDDITQGLSAAQTFAYRRAFEADIINLLVGSLAEAKYVALRDNEPINQYLVTVQALHYYGGASDLMLIGKYFNCFEKHECSDKMTELFLLAYRFIDNRSIWQTIMTLADYIQKSVKNTIAYEEISYLIDQQSK